MSAKRIDREFLHTLTEYQSLRVNGSCVLFLSPFLPFERRLFLLRRLVFSTFLVDLVIMQVRVLTFRQP